MSTYLIQSETLTNIADAIRAKDGLSTAMTPSQMVGRITNIPSGGSGQEDGLIDGSLSTYSNSTVTRVRGLGFYYYTSLTSIDLPMASYIGSSAFYGCSSLISINLPNASYIGSNAFQNCCSLTSINLSNANYIGSYAFYSCPSLTSVDLPIASYIGSYAFYSCYSLALVNLSIASYIENYAFTYCSSLASINLPMVRSIGNGTFSNCYSLALVNLPMASYIGSSAFCRCYRLLSLYLLSTSVATLASENAFTSTPISKYTTSTGGVYGSIYVPSSLYSSYITATNWTVYSSRFYSSSTPTPTPTSTVMIELYYDGDISGAGFFVTSGDDPINCTIDITDSGIDDTYTSNQIYWTSRQWDRVKDSISERFTATATIGSSEYSCLMRGESGAEYWYGSFEM